MRFMLENSIFAFELLQNEAYYKGFPPLSHQMINLLNEKLSINIMDELDLNQAKTDWITNGSIGVIRDCLQNRNLTFKGEDIYNAIRNGQLELAQLISLSI